MGMYGREMYELMPNNSRKSFYGKALVEFNKDGSQTLWSYGTKIMTKKKDGSFVKHYDDWTATTGRHIAAFSGLNKKQYEELGKPAKVKAIKIKQPKMNNSMLNRMSRGI